jgi:lipopolysaccharide export system protein LptA
MRPLRIAGLAAVGLGWLVAAAAAQNAPPAGLQGFSQNRRDPINIESRSLEVRDKEKIAIFIDNVKVVQGDSTLECKTLIVHYDQDKPASGVAKTPRSNSSAPGEQQQIRKLEAKGGVVLTQKDQVATGDNGVYEAQNNTMTLTGNVVLTQGQSVVRGQRLLVDLNTNIARVESSDGGPVRALFPPREQSAPAKPATTSTIPAATAPPRAATTPPRAQQNAAEGERSKPAIVRPQRLN